MITPELFLKFAAECESMAKFSPSQENRLVWNGLAQRWLRCAELMKHQDDLNDRGSNFVKRRQAKVYNSD